MPIGDKTRKLLWGRSGNRCAICKRELVFEATPSDDESVIGDECHIVSGQLGGPRHNPSFSKDEIDSYKNIILLCKLHHKMIDDQHDTYTSEILLQMKANHEKWVKEKLSETAEPKPVRIKRIKDKIPEYLIRLTTGKEILNLVEGGDAFSFGHDELESQQEVELVGGFLQIVRDWGDLGLDLDPHDKVRIGFDLTKTLRELEDAGFYVFGCKEVQLLEGGIEPPRSWHLTTLQVLRKTNESIIGINLNELKTVITRNVTEAKN